MRLPILLFSAHLLGAALVLAGPAVAYRFAGTIGKPGREEGQFRRPQSVAVGPDGSIYVVDRERHRVLKHTHDGVFVLEFGSGVQGRSGLVPDPAKSDQCCFHLPYAVAVAHDGSVYVSDWRNHRIVRNSAAGKYLSEIPGSGVGYDMQLPTSLAVDGKGNVCVLSAGADRQKRFVTFFDSQGQFVEQRRVAGSCLAIALRPSTGDLYVTQNGRYIEYLADGTMTGWMGKGNLHKGTTALLQYRVGWFGKEFLEDRDGFKYYQENGDERGAFDEPQGLAIDEERSRIIVADTRNDRVQVFSLQHELLAVIGQRGTGPGEFRLPMDVAVDSEGSIYVADKYNDRVQKFVVERGPQ